MLRKFVQNTFKDYEPAGQKMILLGIATVFLWLALDIGLLLLGAAGLFTGRVYPYAIFPAFGVLCIFVGMMQKKKAKSKAREVPHVGGLEEIGLIFLGLEILPALAYLSYLVYTNSIYSLAVIPALVLSAFAIYGYWSRHKNDYNVFSRYSPYLLLIAILSHSGWAYYLTKLAMPGAGA
ncbi:MAG: hypothetical protein V1911_03890 [Candidatus Micrarchaeota archaeon]